MVVDIMFYMWFVLSIVYIGCQVLDFFSILRGHKIKEIPRSTIRKQLNILIERYYRSSWYTRWVMCTVILLISEFLKLVSRQ